MRKKLVVVLGVVLVMSSAPDKSVGGEIHVDSASMAVTFAEQTGELIATVEMPSVPVTLRGFAYEQNGEWHQLSKTVEEQRFKGKERIYATDERGEPVALTVEFPEASVAKVTAVPAGHHISRVRFDVAADDQDHFYGMGEPWNETLDQRGESVRMWVKTGTPDQCCFVPFFMSSRGYGIYVEEYHDGVFDFCASHPDRVRITFQNDRLVFYVISGPDMKSVITRYCGITGFPPLPPVWSFMPWKWRNETNRDGVMEDANRMRDLDIPIGVMMIDRPWALGPYGNNDFEFDPGRYPDAEEMIQVLNEMGMEVLVWVCEFNRSDARNFEEGLALGAYCDGPQKGVPTDPDRIGSYHLDFRNPKGYDFWKREMQKVIRLGVAGFKLDRGQSIGDNARYANGESGHEMHNYHGYLFNQCCFEALQEIRGNDFTMLPRSGWAGSQKFAMAKWPGDMSASFDNYSGLPAVVLNQQTIGLSGFPFYGSDIGGFSRKTSVPVFARWVEHGALSPIMQCPHQAWEYGDEMVRIYRKYAKLHTQLIPYIYHYAGEAHQTGIPITRALALEFQDDPNVANLWSEYMFGESLLVAPVIREENLRDIYLPKGGWYDFWSGEEHQGPVTLPGEQDIPLDVLPLFARAGSVIPMDVSDEVTGCGGAFSRGALTVDVYPPVPGDVAAREKQFRLPDEEVRVETRRGERSIAFRCSAPSSKVVVRLLCPEPDRLSDNGRPMTEGGEGKEGTWFYDTDVGRVYAFLAAGNSHDLRIELDKG